MNKKRILKPWVRIIILLFYFLLIIFSIFLIYKDKNPSLTSKYNYKKNSDIKYKVFLKENNFYEEKYLEENLQYTTDLINYIDVDFNYLLTSSRKTIFNYSYDVVATVIGEYENSSGRGEIWKKEEVLIPSENKILPDSATFNIKQNVIIDYQKYNNIVKEYIQNFNFSIDAYLNIKLKVSYNGTISDINSTIKDEDILEINIPLNKPTIKIDTNYEKEVVKDLDETETNKLSKGYIILVVTIILFAISIPSIFVSNKSSYERELDRLLKNYGEIIVEVEELPNLNDLELLNIKEFDDMIDIEEEIKSPIIFKELNESAWFIIVSDKYVYRYVLRK